MPKDIKIIQVRSGMLCNTHCLYHIPVVASIVFYFICTYVVLPRHSSIIIDQGSVRIGDERWHVYTYICYLEHDLMICTKENKVIVAPYEL